jgi:hypothetical protein
VYGVASKDGVGVKMSKKNLYNIKMVCLFLGHNGVLGMEYDKELGRS